MQYVHKTQPRYQQTKIKVHSMIFTSTSSSEKKLIAYHYDIYNRDRIQFNMPEIHHTEHIGNNHQHTEKNEE